ncbi:phosphatase PAP2 family protein [Wenjunlia tyrosinilytica]|uniref:Phosphatase PAP2 family protein n=1 Tax=Wenjunlia tyrosinilytica TaxID=1544741 RepID=A0A918DY62_9ACTN|nr:phosphatase PAP2 family protein [Wenjunlia tyrosinilytica]GGO91073.1 phosphatase PAP2 family protein [Wenjunlia tyrosinilytica]
MRSPAESPNETGVPHDAGDRRARRASAWTAAALTGCAAVLLSLVETGWGPLRSADHSIANSLHRAALAHSGWTHADRVLTDWVWDPLTMRLLTLAVIVRLVLRGATRLAAWVAASALAGLVVQSAVKAAVGRARPHLPHPVDSAANGSFPSGHAMTAAVTCTLLVWLVALTAPSGRRSWSAVAAALAAVSILGVGFTRMFLGVHWFSDVLAGWLLGGAVVACCAAVMSPWRAPSRGPRLRGWRA